MSIRKIISSPEKIVFSQNFNGLWENIMDHVKNVADRFDKQWRKRHRKIGTEFLLLFIFKMVMSKNKQGYGSLLQEIWRQFAFLGTTTYQDKPFSQSSVCDARQKLSPQVFVELNNHIVNEWDALQGHLYRFRGHRIFGIDGSKINLPTELIDNGYKTPCENAYYPQGLLSCLYEVQSGITYDFEITNHGNERFCALNHLKTLEPNDIVVFDRGYFSFYLLRKYVDKNIFPVFRMQKGCANKLILDFWDSEESEKTILYTPSERVKSDIRKSDPHFNFDPITVRLIKYSIDGETYVLLTTLLDPEYSRQFQSELYHARWGSEEYYKISKCFTQVDDFHSKTENGIKQELYAHFCLQNLSRILEQQCVVNEKELISTFNFDHFDNFHSIFNMLNINIKFNFKNILLVFSDSIVPFILFSSVRFITEQIPVMIDSVQHLYQKIRPNRHYPRVSHKPVNKWRNNSKKVKRAT